MNVLSKVSKASFNGNEVVCIVPTLNECTTVADVIIKAKQYTDWVIVVDGYSTDGTCEIALDAGAEVILQEGKGKGMALRTVFKKITADIFIIIDGDGTYDALETDKLVQPILNGEADMVVGSRFNGRMEDGSISQTNLVGNMLFNFLLNYLYKGKVTDSQSGYRAMNKTTVESLKLDSTGFEVETEITVKALKQGLIIKEVPITYTKRRDTSSKLNSFKDGSRILKTIIYSS